VLRSLIAETYLRSLEIPGVRVISSGTNVDWSDSEEREYFANTLAVLGRHRIADHAKQVPDQLTRQRIDEAHDVVVLMNQRVMDEALALVTLPKDVHNWNITDIGEGVRTNPDNRELYEEQIYQELTAKVDKLVATRLMPSTA